MTMNQKGKYELRRRNVEENYEVMEADIDIDIHLEPEDDFEDELDIFLNEVDPGPTVDAVDGDQNKEPDLLQPNI